MERGTDGGNVRGLERDKALDRKRSRSTRRLVFYRERRERFLRIGVRTLFSKPKRISENKGG